MAAELNKGLSLNHSGKKKELDFKAIYKQGLKGSSYYKFIPVFNILLKIQ